jgi:predicted RecB family endonuclease
MTGRASRSKGARGQSEFKALLLDRDWTVDSITAGIAAADLIATDRDGTQYSVEVKNCAGILPAHKRQAMTQAKARKLPWLLASKIAGTASWLVQRQGATPVVWSGKSA